MNLVEIRVINVDNPVWVDDLRVFCLEVLKCLGKRNWSISIVLCDNEFIRGLNEKYRRNDTATDVLSFSQEAGMPTVAQFTAGDVVISLEYAKRNATAFGSTDGNELKRLVVHGILHLDGMVHEKDSTSGEMLDLQERILQDHALELMF